MEPDAEGVTAGTGTTPAAFYLGLCRLRGIQSPPTSAILQAGHSSLPQRKLESDAELCRGGDCRHSGGFLLRIMPPSWHPVPACVRYGILQAKPFSLAATENRIGRGPRCRYDHCRRAVLSYSSDDAASIRKSGPEIKNRCTQEGINRQNLASIPKSGLEIKNRCMQQAIFSTRSLYESLRRYVGGVSEACRRCAGANLCVRWFGSGGKSGC